MTSLQLLIFNRFQYVSHFIEDSQRTAGADNRTGTPACIEKMSVLKTLFRQTTLKVNLSDAFHARILRLKISELALIIRKTDTFRRKHYFCFPLDNIFSQWVTLIHVHRRIPCHSMTTSFTCRSKFVSLDFSGT